MGRGCAEHGLPLRDRPGKQTDLATTNLTSPSPLNCVLLFPSAARLAPLPAKVSCPSSCRSASCGRSGTRLRPSALTRRRASRPPRDLSTRSLPADPGDGRYPRRPASSLAVIHGTRIARPVPRKFQEARRRGTLKQGAGVAAIEHLLGIPPTSAMADNGPASPRRPHLNPLVFPPARLTSMSLFVSCATDHATCRNSFTTFGVCAKPPQV